MCTLEKRGDLFFLTFTGDDDHRLTPTLITSLRSLLAELKSQATPGSVLITTAEGRFFSNGLDLSWIRATASISSSIQRLNCMIDELRLIVATFISLPLPTIAVVSGHAAGAGLILAISHDYVLMRRDKGFLYMSELDMGATVPDYFFVLMRSKIGSCLAQREVLLRGRKVKGEEAVKMGIVESAHDGIQSLMEAAVRLGTELAKMKWHGEVYSEIRKGLYADLCALLGLQRKHIVPTQPRSKM